MLGIDNLKKFVKLGFDMAEQTIEAGADGKYTWTDSFGFFDELMQIPSVVSKWKDTVAELKELDAIEKQQLYDYAVAEFDIPNDKVESFVENALMMGISFVNLIQQFKGLKKVP